MVYEETYGAHKPNNWTEECQNYADRAMIRSLPRINPDADFNIDNSLEYRLGGEEMRRILIDTY